MSDLTDSVTFPAHKPVLAGPNYNSALAPKDATPADSYSLQVVAQRLAERDEAIQQRLAADPDPAAAHLAGRRPRNLQKLLGHRNSLARARRVCQERPEPSVQINLRNRN